MAILLIKKEQRRYDFGDFLTNTDDWMVLADVIDTLKRSSRVLKDNRIF